MKKASDVFKSIRFAKGETRDKPHSSTVVEGHYSVGEKEFNQQLKHVKKMAMQEGKKDKYDEGEYDQEGDMVKSDLRSIIANAQKLHNMIDDDDNLPEWCQNKVTLAEDYISTVANYLTAEMNEATSTSVRMQRALERIKQSREASERRAQELLKPKQPTQPVQKEEVDESYDGPRGDKLMARSHAAYRAGDKETSTRAHQLAKRAGEKYRSNPENREKAIRHIMSGAKADYNKPGRNWTGDSVEYPEDTNVVSEEIEYIEEKNAPTNPELWSKAKALARSKFDVYPSAYANGWAAKWYKSKGGGWKSVSESKEDLPFEPDPKPKKQVVPGKYGAGYSTARHLARMAMQKQSEKMKKPIKEEEMSKKAQIVKSIAKKKKESADTFQKDPIISKTEVKM
jgi:hypothetical protein